MDDENRGKKSRKVEDMKNDVKKMVVDELGELKDRVTDVLHETTLDDGVPLRDKLSTIKEMLADYAEGVQTWKRKATVAVADIEHRQRSLKNLMHETTSKAQRRKEQFAEGQAKRARDTEEMCRQIMLPPK